jgi:MerR family transcriptional regulator/heat shock protein HspR
VDPRSSEPPANQPVYGISVMTELTGVHPQALRDYENKGLLSPHRTSGGTRRYSQDDVERVHQVTALLADGANLAAARKILDLESEVARLTAELERFRARRR